MQWDLIITRENLNQIIKFLLELDYQALNASCQSNTYQWFKMLKEKSDDYYSRCHKDYAMLFSQHKREEILENNWQTIQQQIIILLHYLTDETHQKLLACLNTYSRIANKYSSR